jgi:uncharacterized membrane protein YeaQ/YmgE (transglycosylase-associated protein family)
MSSLFLILKPFIAIILGTISAIWVLYWLELFPKYRIKNDFLEFLVFIIGTIILVFLNGIVIGFYENNNF